MQKNDVWELLPHQLAALGDQAHQGEEVVITRDGQPWLRLTPCPDYTPPPAKPREEYRAKMAVPQGSYKGSANPLRKPWALLPEQDLCAECRAKYHRDTAPAAKGGA